MGNKQSAKRADPPCDTCDNCDTGEASPPATPATRERILEGLAPIVRGILDHDTGKPDALRGWALLHKYGVRPAWSDGPERAPLMVSNERLKPLLDDAKTDGAAFDLACRVIADRVLVDAPMPDFARVFAAAVLTGLRTRPKSGRGHGGRVTLRMVQYLLCLEVKAEFEIPLTPNDEPSPHRGGDFLTACELVADAFTAAGSHVEARKLKDYCYHKSHSDMRKTTLYWFNVGGQTTPRK